MPRRLQQPLLSPHSLSWLLALSTLFLLVFLWAPSAGAAMVIDRCGLEIPDGETAYLVTDLDCAGTGVEGVVLGHRSRLFLLGHTISSDPSDPGGRQGIRCRTGTVCTVVGPGLITGFAASGVAGTRVRLRDLVIAGNGRSGVVAFENIILRNVRVEGNGDVAIHAGGRVRARRVVTDDGMSDIVAEHAPPYIPGCPPS